MRSGDTIAAIATPLGIGGIGVIRVSGPDALTLSHQFTPSSTHPRILPNMMIYTSIIHPLSHALLDDGCVVFFKAPKSYTGEPVVEFHLHGSIHILRKVLGALIEQGARPADPGEFTQRAFINGKMDLTKAESVIDVIHASSDKAHAVALNHLKGHLFDRIQAIRHTLMRILEQVEGSLDFPDEVDPIDRPEVKAILLQLTEQIQHILSLKDFGRWISNGIKCVIVGRPNAGKSSLMNCLAGEDRAIVSAIPGTTRDFIEVRVELGGILFEFIDTAGIRDTHNVVELIGVKRVKKLIQSADVILWVLDQTQVLTPDDHSIFSQLKRKKNKIIVLNKADKKRRLSLDALSSTPLPYLSISAKSKQGISELKTTLYDQFVGQLDGLDMDLICNVRQQHCLATTLTHLTTLIQGMDTAPVDDLFSFDLKQAILTLGEVTGDTFNEEVLDGIFSRFCVGK